MRGDEIEMWNCYELTDSQFKRIKHDLNEMVHKELNMD